MGSYLFTVMIVTQVWFNGYDIASDMTETDILDGTAIIVMVTLHISLGIYAHRLAHRLFIQPKIFDMMRLHAKTMVKVTIERLQQYILNNILYI